MKFLDGLIENEPSVGDDRNNASAHARQKKEYACQTVKPFSLDSRISLRSSTHMHVLIELWKRQMAWAIKRHFMQSGSPSASFLDGPSRLPW